MLLCEMFEPMVLTWSPWVDSIMSAMCLDSCSFIPFKALTAATVFWAVGYLV